MISLRMNADVCMGFSLQVILSSKIFVWSMGERYEKYDTYSNGIFISSTTRWKVLIFSCHLSGHLSVGHSQLCCNLRRWIFLWDIQYPNLTLLSKLTKKLELIVRPKMQVKWDMIHIRCKVNVNLKVKHRNKIQAKCKTCL